MLRKSVTINCPWCNAELNGKIPRFGIESSQVQCTKCGKEIVALSYNGSVGLFVR